MSPSAQLIEFDPNPSEEYYNDEQPAVPEIVAPKKKRKRSHRRKTKSTNTAASHRNLASMSAVEQVSQAFARGHRLSAVMGFVLGGFIPVATFTLVHHDVKDNQLLWVLIVGGLLYSAISVFRWAKTAFRMTAKAVGFVVLLEGVVTFAHTTWLPMAGLFILVAINGISAASALQAKEEI